MSSLLFRHLSSTATQAFYGTENGQTKTNPTSWKAITTRDQHPVPKCYFTRVRKQNIFFLIYFSIEKRQWRLSSFYTPQSDMYKPINNSHLLCPWRYFTDSNIVTWDRKWANFSLFWASTRRGFMLPCWYSQLVRTYVLRTQVCLE